MESGGVVTVGETLAVLEQWHPRLLAGQRGLGRRVTWAGTMRARLPAFEGFTGGELALLSLGTLRLLRAQVDTLTLVGLVDELALLGAAAIAIADPDEGPGARPSEVHAREAAIQRAEVHGIPLLELPGTTPLPPVERAVIRYVVAQRERPAPTASVGTADELHATLRAEALHALLTGTYASDALMTSRAVQLGFDLARPHAVLAVELAGADGSRENGPASHTRASARLAHDLTNGATVGATNEARALADTLEVSLGAWVRARDAEVVAVLPLLEDHAIGDVVARVRELLERTLGAESANWAAGLGEPARSSSGIQRSADEAHAAGRLGRQVLGPGHIVRPADLGVYRLLLALRRVGELAPFVEQTLAPLRSDRRIGEALIVTLDVFFMCNGNLSRAAEHLHLHRNSLLYRLHRIRELLGYDLEDADQRLALQLALKGRHVLAME